MDSAGLVFMIVAWGVILAACVFTLTSLVKHSK